MRETGRNELFISNRDVRFSINARNNGLFFIHMAKGGALPQICHGSYTSYKKAKQALEAYLDETDRLGRAVYPSKVENGKS